MELTPADRDLTNEIVYGVLRWQNRLDYILEARASRSARRIDQPILLALRIGLYQILFLDRVPQRSAVDEAVKIAHRYGPRGAGSFVNAVLRAVCRNPNQPVLPDRNGDPLRYLSITLSHPEWLARRYFYRLGLDGAEARCRFHNAPAPVDLRVEPVMSVEEAQKALKGEGIETERFPHVPHCLRVVKGKPTRSPLHAQGSIFIQEAGSQLIPHLLAVRPGDRVLDACAAPGAKATELARWTEPGLVIALERRPRRLELMAALARRLNCQNLIPLGGDAGALPLRGSFRTILLDAPCSSLGTLARNPDIKWRVREKDSGRFRLSTSPSVDSMRRDSRGWWASRLFHMLHRARRKPKSHPAISRPPPRLSNRPTTGVLPSGSARTRERFQFLDDPPRTRPNGRLFCGDPRKTLTLMRINKSGVMVEKGLVRFLPISV